MDFRRVLLAPVKTVENRKRAARRGERADLEDFADLCGASWRYAARRFVCPCQRLVCGFNRTFAVSLPLPLPPLGNLGYFRPPVVQIGLFTPTSRPDTYIFCGIFCGKTTGCSQLITLFTIQCKIQPPPQNFEIFSTQPVVIDTKHYRTMISLHVHRDRQQQMCEIRSHICCAMLAPVVASRGNRNDLFWGGCGAC